MRFAFWRKTGWPTTTMGRIIEEWGVRRRSGEWGTNRSQVYERPHSSNPTPDSPKYLVISRVNGGFERLDRRTSGKQRGNACAACADALFDHEALVGMQRRVA